MRPATKKAQGSKDPSLTSMFNFSHLMPESGFQVVLFILYVPFGLSLLFFRLLLFAAFGFFFLLFPEEFFFPQSIVRILLPLFGIRVSIDKSKLKKVSKVNAGEGSKVVMVCNHWSSFDVFPFLVDSNVNVIIDKGFFESNFIAKQFNKICGAVPIDRTAAKATLEGQQQLREMIVDKIEKSKYPLLVFPEGWDTNGQRGLLIFQKFLFSLGKRVQPVALRCSIPLLPMARPNVLGSTILKEVLFLFFVPYFRYELTYLPQQMQEPEETPEQFARRVQEMIAKQLNIVATHYTFKDALTLRKSRLEGSHVHMTPSSSSSSSFSSSSSSSFSSSTPASPVVVTKKPFFVPHSMAIFWPAFSNSKKRE